MDYGRAYRLLAAGSEPEITDAVLGYVSRPLPPVRALPRQELDRYAARVAAHYVDLQRQLGQEPATGLRDLVASGRLLRVQVVG